MKLMLDTDICVEIIRKRSGPILAKLQRCDLDDICISAITLSELEYGASKSAAPERNRLALAEFMIPVQVVAYDDMAASCYGEIRARLEQAGIPIGPLDTLIAAHALALKLTLVTRNGREFSRVPGLRVVNWAK
ncbi:MAG: type II toxin-antitoxin system VapC family toxin [Lentisphaerae bacterium]|nr:type II toxin-antitoxin system VapC family toxin [Lentisphaerota bacterium]